MTNQERQMTMTEQQRSIEYLAGRPEVPVQAKAEREPCVHPRWAAFERAGAMTCPDCCEVMPRWVRCSDRLPGDGREYEARHCGMFMDWGLRYINGRVEKTLTGSDYWIEESVLADMEWLDEAPAQEGQRESAVAISEKGGLAISEVADRHSDSHPMPPGTLTRAMRQRRAEQELLAVKQDFWRTIGRGKR